MLRRTIFLKFSRGWQKHECRPKINKKEKKNVGLVTDDGFVADVSGSQIAFLWNAEKYALSCIFPLWSSYIIMLVWFFRAAIDIIEAFARISWFHPTPDFQGAYIMIRFIRRSEDWERNCTDFRFSERRRDPWKTFERSRGRFPKFFRVISPASMDH